MKSLNFSIKEDSIGWLEWDQPDSSVNLLNLSLIQELPSLFKQIEETKVKVLVFISKKVHSFCAGADIREIQNIKTEKEIRDVLDKVHDFFFQFEQLNTLKICAIQGVCLGGGLEWALCCDYRLSADSSHVQIGLPEVQLGLIPGFGACFRLPRLVGLKESLGMILTGKSLTAWQAHKIGLVDEKVPPLVLEKRALKLAREIVRGEKKVQKNIYKNLKPYSFFMERALKTILCSSVKKKTLKKTKNFYPAPLKALEVICKTYGSLVSKNSVEVEKKAFCEVWQSSVSENLLRVFTMIDRTKKIKFDKSLELQKQKTIERIGVLGAGVMGRAIAYTFADKGFKVRLIDNKKQSLCSALSFTERLWQEQRQRGKIDSYELKQKMCNLSVSTKLWGLSTLDMLIEALPEDKELKQKTVADISKKLNSSCLFASNTSSFCISDLAQSSLYPENFFGLHFFNPVYKMRLVEVSLTKGQEKLPIYSVRQVIKKLGKVPLFVQDSPGFIVNRLLAVYLTEALFLCHEGHGIEDVDRYYRDHFGMAFGPFQLMDKIGLDVCLGVIFNLLKAGLQIEIPKWTDHLTEILGQGEKSGKGFYIYDNKKVSLNKNVEGLKRTEKDQVISSEDIVQRGIYRMINEGQKLLRDKVVELEDDIDVALILGAGFPAFLGGPMNYGKNIGWSVIRKKLEEFENRYGSRFKPCF